NNAVGPLVVPRLPIGSFVAAGFDRRRGSGLASIPHSGAEKEREMAAGDGIEVLGPPRDRFEEILTPDPLSLVATLHPEVGGPPAPPPSGPCGRRARGPAPRSPATSGTTTSGRCPRPRRAWWTAGWRSPGPPSGR